MNINSINNFSIQTLPQKLPFLGNFGIKGNLAPLEKDTVSFTSNVSKTSSKKMDYANRPNLAAATKVYQDSEYDFDQFKYTLGQIFDAPVIEMGAIDYKGKINRAIDERQNKPIIMIETRRKTPTSIAEKMASLKLNSADEAKNEMHDIIGARIILSSPSKKDGDQVLETLTNAVKKGKIKILEIKNHSQENPELHYASRGKLGKLLTACRKKTPMCSYKDEPRDSGYLAIHLITDKLSNGYKAEIQIMGLEVAKFKEVEDLCYKCHSGKALHSKYKSLQKEFEPLKDKNTMEEYLEYTKRAYARERLKTEHKKGSLEEFLPIPKDLKKIPKNLDFNTIANKKRILDLK